MSFTSKDYSHALPRLLCILTYSGLLSAWMLKVGDHYFDLSSADVVAAAIVVIASIAFALIRIFERLPLWLVVLISSVTPLVLYPLTSELILHVQLSYVAFYSYLFIGIIAISRISMIRAYVIPVLSAAAVWLMPFNFIASQEKYYDRVIESLDTRMGVIDLVQWKKDYWIYYLDQLQFSTLDGHMYGEAFVHPAMSLIPVKAKVIVIGGDNGLMLKELGKYPDFDVEVIPYDQEFAEFTRSRSDIFGSTPIKAEFLLTNAWQHLIGHPATYDGILIDLPDLEDAHIHQYYSQEFFVLCRKALRPQGILVTQTGNPYFDQGKLQITQRTVESTGMYSLPYHTHIPTIGEWSWLIAGSSNILQPKLDTLSVSTKWIDEEAMQLMLHFGNMSYFHGESEAVHSIRHPALGNRGKQRL